MDDISCPFVFTCIEPSSITDPQPFHEICPFDLLFRAEYLDSFSDFCFELISEMFLYGPLLVVLIRISQIIEISEYDEFLSEWVGFGDLFFQWEIFTVSDEIILALEWSLIKNRSMDLFFDLVREDLGMRVRLSRPYFFEFFLIHMSIRTEIMSRASVLRLSTQVLSESTTIELCSEFRDFYLKIRIFFRGSFCCRFESSLLSEMIEGSTELRELEWLLDSLCSEPKRILSFEMSYIWMRPVLFLKSFCLISMYRDSWEKIRLDQNIEESRLSSDSSFEISTSETTCSSRGILDISTLWISDLGKYSHSRSEEGVCFLLILREESPSDRIGPEIETEYLFAHKKKKVQRLYSF